MKYIEYKNIETIKNKYFYLTNKIKRKITKIKMKSYNKMKILFNKNLLFKILIAKLIFMIQ